MRKSTEKIVFDKAVADLYPFLPISYATRAHELYPTIAPERLRNVVRLRGTAPDWEAFEALKRVSRPAPVARKPRKKHKPRALQTA